jgi:hypothetical protein
VVNVWLQLYKKLSCRELGGFDLVDEEKPTNSLDVFNPHEPMTEEPSLFQHAVVLALRTATFFQLHSTVGKAKSCQKRPTWKTHPQ